MTVIPSPFGPLPDCPLPVHDLLMQRINHAVATNPAKKAFISAEDPSDSVTYLRLRDETLALTQFLANRSFHRETACIVLSNRYEYVPFTIAVTSRGGTLSGVSALFTQTELAQQFRDSKCTTIFTDVDHMERVAEAIKGNNHIKTILVVGTKRGTFLPKNYCTWEQAVATVVNKDLKPVAINIDKDIAMLPYSSGTTGVPKGVMLSHRNFSAVIRGLAHWTTNVDSRGRRFPINWANEHILVFLPFYHMFGTTMLGFAILLESPAVVMKSFHPVLFLESIQKYRIPMLNVVPPILLFLAKSPLCSNYDLSSLRRITSAAAPAGKDLCDDAMRRFPNLESIQQVYGLSECVLCTAPDEKSRAKIGCSGRVATGHEMKLVDADTGIAVSRGQRGEIWMRGPAVMAGYLGREQATRETIVDGWLRTGDIAYMDDDGDVFIVDRLKELIKVKGLQVAPAELEDLLLAHPLIVDAAVIGVPDERSGELPKAFIVRANDSLTEKEVQDHIRGTRGMKKERTDCCRQSVVIQAPRGRNRVHPRDSTDSFGEDHEEGLEGKRGEG